MMMAMLQGDGDGEDARQVVVVMMIGKWMR